MPETFTSTNPQYTVPSSGAIPSPVQLSSQGQSNISGSIPNIGSNINNNFSTTPSGSLSSSKNKLDDFKKQLDTIKGKTKETDPFKNINDPSSFLKQQKLSVSKNQIITVLTPIVSQFIKTEFIARLIIEKLKKQTREQVKNKGTLTIVDGIFTFTPSSPGDYSIFKNDFDRKVTNLKTTITKLKQVITLLNNIIKFINIGLSITQILIKLKLARLNAKLAAITADLASPSPSKSSGANLITVINDILKIQKTEKKIDEYKKAVTIARSILIIFNTALKDIKIKLDQLQFIIVSSAPTTPGVPSNSNSDLVTSINDISTTSGDEEYVDNFGKSYILKLVTLINGTKQYQALDAFSKLKITQTAPSRIKTPEQLLEEIKQILG